MQHPPLQLALLSACSLLPLFAAHAGPLASPDVADLSQSSVDRITVTASLTERVIADMPATVELILRKRLDRERVVDFGDLVCCEPGVSATRFGIQDVRIRGLGGNRVQQRRRHRVAERMLHRRLFGFGSGPGRPGFTEAGRDMRGASSRSASA